MHAWLTTPMMPSLNINGSIMTLAQDDVHRLILDGIIKMSWTEDPTDSQHNAFKPH